MLNSVQLIGRLARDPEQRSTTSGKSVATFSLAVKRAVKPGEGQDVDFFRVVAWEKQSEYVMRYLSKGRLIAVQGRLVSRKYAGSDGQAREVIEVVAESVQGLDKPKEEAVAA